MLKNHPLIQGAMSSKKNHNPLVALLIMVAMLIVGQLMGLPLMVILHPIVNLLPDTVYFNALSDALFILALPFGGTILAVYLYLRFIEKRPFTTIGLPLKPVNRSQQGLINLYVKGFLLGVAAMAAFVAIALALGVYDFKGFKFHLEISTLTAVVFMLPGWFIQGASEEILTRGWLFQATLKKHLYLGVFMSTIAFSLLHLANDGLSFLSLLNLTLYGLFALVLCLYTENLWAACGFHASWNWAQGNVFGILVSGSTTRAGSIFSLGATKGPHWLTGGPFGAEGSIIVSALLLLLIVLCLIGIKKKVPSWSEKSSCAPCPHSES